jgi:hypothetical protein
MACYEAVTRLRDWANSEPATDSLRGGGATGAARADFTAGFATTALPADGFCFGFFLSIPTSVGVRR